MFPLRPAAAKSYDGRELGAWEGPMYVARTKSAKRNAAFRKAVKKSGYADSAPKRKAKSKATTKRFAALGNGASGVKPRKSLTGGGSGGGVRWAANSGCLSPALKSVIYQVASYGAVTVSSTCRSRGHNARVGGARKSHHLTGSAADFRVHGNVGAAYAFLRNSGSVGGLKHYGGGLFHIDTGARRSF